MQIDIGNDGQSDGDNCSCQATIFKTPRERQPPRSLLTAHIYTRAGITRLRRFVRLKLSTYLVSEHHIFIVQLNENIYRLVA